MKRLLAATATTAIALAAVLGLAVHGASADAPTTQGWWTQTSPSTPLGAAPPVASDVPSNGLLIEGGAAAPVAYAALVYSLGPGAQVGKLTLQIAPSSATTPNSSLELCPLEKPTLHAEQGGPMSDAPAYTCETHVTAAPSDGGYQFDVTQLVSDGALAVAILPTDPTTRVVLSQPDANSLPVVAAAGTAGSDEPTSDAFGSTASPYYDAGSISAPYSSDVPSVPSLAAPAIPTPAAEPAPAAAAAPVADLGDNALTRSTPARPLAVSAIVIALAAGLAAWGRAGSSAVRGAAALSGESGQP
jgi:hypothetical protein